jgi:hypothetical protein
MWRASLKTTDNVSITNTVNQQMAELQRARPAINRRSVIEQRSGGHAHNGRCPAEEHAAHIGLGLLFGLDRPPRARGAAGRGGRRPRRLALSGLRAARLAPRWSPRRRQRRLGDRNALLRRGRAAALEAPLAPRVGLHAAGARQLAAVPPRARRALLTSMRTRENTSIVLVAGRPERPALAERLPHRPGRTGLVSRSGMAPAGSGRRMGLDGTEGTPDAEPAAYASPRIAERASAAASGPRPTGTMGNDATDAAGDTCADEVASCFCGAAAA